MIEPKTTWTFLANAIAVLGRMIDACLPAARPELQHQVVRVDARRRSNLPFKR